MGSHDLRVLRSPDPPAPDATDADWSVYPHICRGVVVTMSWCRGSCRQALGCFKRQLSACTASVSPLTHKITFLRRAVWLDRHHLANSTYRLPMQSIAVARPNAEPTLQLSQSAAQYCPQRGLRAGAILSVASIFAYYHVYSVHDRSV